MCNTKKYSVYILKCGDGSYYTGMTSDLERRMLSHLTCDEMCAKHTKFRQPVELVFLVSNIANGTLARKGEKYIKVLTRELKEELIKGNEKRLKLLYKRFDKECDLL